MAIKDEDRARLEQLGEARVRLQALTPPGFSHPFQYAALEWLSELDKAERARNEASQVSQMRTALSAKNAAWIAAIAAIVAAIIAIIGIIVTASLWLYPRHLAALLGGRPRFF